MEKELVTYRIRARSLAKPIFFGLLAVFYPIWQIASFFAGGGVVSMSLQGRQLYGLEAILWAPVFAIVFSMFFTLLAVVGIGVGTRVFARFAPTKIRYIEIESDRAP